jgi:hypothetical protein
MALEHVPKEHVAHALERALDRRRVSNVDARKQWRERLKSHDAADYGAALEFIRGALPGELERIADLWIFPGQRALHLWTLPFLTGKTATGALSGHQNIMRRSRSDSSWMTLPSRAKAALQVHEVRVADNVLSLRVWITKTLNFQFQEEEQHKLRTETVLVQVRFEDGVEPIAEVYATIRDARTALFGALDWLRGSVTPRTKSKAQEAIMRPVVFSEGQISLLAGRLRWGEPTEVRGLDATNEVGELSMAGKKTGFKPGSLDRAVRKVQQQLGALNAARRYNLAFAHPDGFEEQPEASFHFQGGQSRIQFHTRTSRLAMWHVIGEVRTQLKV